MTRMTNLAVAADYADAMLVARRAKNWLFLLLLLLLLMQIGIFLTARFVPNVHLTATVESAAGSVSTTQVAIMQPQPLSPRARLAAPFIRFLIDMSDFLGVMFAIALAIDLLLIVGIMLVGRLVGVTHVTSAFVWCVVLTVFLIPWQSLLNGNTRTIKLLKDWRGHAANEVIETDGTSAAALIDAGVAESDASVPPAATADVRVPGVLYTWPELARDYDFDAADTKVAVLKWARFTGFPGVAVILLMVIQARSSRGLRFALGEAEVTVPPGAVGI